MLAVKLFVEDVRVEVKEADLPLSGSNPEEVLGDLSEDDRGHSVLKGDGLLDAIDRKDSELASVSDPDVIVDDAHGKDREAGEFLDESSIRAVADLEAIHETEPDVRADDGHGVDALLLSVDLLDALVCVCVPDAEVAVRVGGPQVLLVLGHHDRRDRLCVAQ